MSNSPARRFLLTVIQLPVTCCQICHRTIADQPGEVRRILTEHYRAYPEVLSLCS